jgi:hypothetical protein
LGFSSWRIDRLVDADVFKTAASTARGASNKEMSFMVTEKFEPTFGGNG